MKYCRKRTMLSIIEWWQRQRQRNMFQNERFNVYIRWNILKRLMTHNNHCPLEDKDKLLKRPNMCRAVSQFLWFFWLSWGPLGSLVSLKVDQFHYSHISRHFLWEIYNWILFISSLWELTEALYLFPGSMWCISTENTVASWIFSTLENISCSYFWFSLVWQLSL